MCGICGMFFGDNRPVSSDLIELMKDRIVHRGPDEEGTFVAGSVGLGSRRLSILDLGHGRQPIANASKTIWTVHNGEIYNFRELRRELEEQGCRFRTETDTEVLVYGYEVYGTDLFRRLNGMFASAIWDQRNRRLLLARDRMGIKPLYYAASETYFAFASEPRALMALPFVEPAINHEAILPYLCLEYVPSPRTMFRGIHRLEPGHFMVVQEGSARPFKYWDFDLARSERLPRRGVKEYVGDVRDALQKAVSAELISDVPVGVLLSGGTDSSAVAACAAQAVSGPLNTFTLGFSEPSFDESQHARAVARALGARHHHMTATPTDALKVIDALPTLIDEPLGDSSFIPTFLISRFAREHVKVVLGGDGGDELFGGYPTLQAHRVARALNLLPSGFWNLAGRALSHVPTSMDYLSLDFKVKRFVKGMPYPSPYRHHVWLGSLDPVEARSLLARDFVGSLHAVDPFDDITRQMRGCGASRLLNQIMYLDTKLYLEGDILTKVDRASMACSLETRVPLLNSFMLDVAESLPLDLKIRGLTRRYAFREAVRGLVPEPILKRPKQGFNMPVAHWIRGPLRGLVLDALSPDRLRRQGLFDPPRIEHLLQEHFQGRRDNRKVLWTLLMFQVWHEHQIETPTHPASSVPV